jgi:putative nucleotidyltransferase with HDIG domain
MRIFAFLLGIAIILIALAITVYPPILGDRYVLEKQDAVIHVMYNCANPEGIVVDGSGRVIAYGEKFEVYGSETVIEETGYSFWQVIDGTVNADYICEYKDETMDMYKKLEAGLSMIDTAMGVSNQYHNHHSPRVAVWCTRFCKEMGYEPDFEKSLYWAALLHDIGKIIIPESVLNKVPRLSRTDWFELHAHPVTAADMIASLGDEFRIISSIVRHHHERWDGTGYPDGIKETTIPLGSRILAPFDSLDALTNLRVYRPVYSVTQALAIMDREIGRKFDPEIYAKFRTMVDV